MKTEAKFVIKRVTATVGKPEYYAINEGQDTHYWVSKPEDANKFDAYPEAESEIENNIKTEGAYNIEKLFFKD